MATSEVTVQSPLVDNQEQEVDSQNALPKIEKKQKRGFRQLSLDENKVVKERFEQGFSLSQIAEDYQISTNSIKEIFGNSKSSVEKRVQAEEDRKKKPPKVQEQCNIRKLWPDEADEMISKINQLRLESNNKNQKKQSSKEDKSPDQELQSDEQDEALDKTLSQKKTKQSEQESVLDNTVDSTVAPVKKTGKQKNNAQTPDVKSDENNKNQSNKKTQKKSKT